MRMRGLSNLWYRFRMRRGWLTRAEKQSARGFFPRPWADPKESYERWAWYALIDECDDGSLKKQWEPSRWPKDNYGTLWWPRREKGLEPDGKPKD